MAGPAKGHRDIYNRLSSVFNGAMSADGAKLSFPMGGEVKKSVAGLIVQNLQVSYAQQVTKLFEIGSPAVYYIVGRASGQMQINHVLGPARLGAAFLRRYGDACNIKNNTIELSAASGCTTAEDNGMMGSFSLTTYYCLITSLSLGMQVDNMMISESLTLMFASLDYDDDIAKKPVDDDPAHAARFA